MQSGDPEATTTKTNIPVSEISDLAIDNFDMYQLGEPNETKGQVTAAKSYLYNAPI